MTMNIGVHTRHCCARHGCKYRDEDCPVALGTHKAEYGCEDCDEDAIRLKHEAHFLANHPERFVELLQAINMSEEIEHNVYLAVKVALKQLGFECDHEQGCKHDHS
jgi:hypothetical protein